MKTYIENLNWRYATKKFNSSRKISEEEIEKLMEAIQLSASSYGLQPYEFLIIKDKELRNKLKLAAFNQSQITDSSHLLVFANIAEIDNKNIKKYLNNISDTRETSRGNLLGLEQMLANTVINLSPEEKNQ